MKRHRIAVFPGDGIGPEIVREALKILGVVSKETGVSFETKEGLVGGAAYDQSGSPLPDDTMQLALSSDAVLLGAVGGPKWEPLEYRLRPERGLLGLRSGLGLYANLRPVVVSGSGEVDAGRHGGGHRSAEDASLHQPLPFPGFVDGMHQRQFIFAVQRFRDLR